MLIERTGFPFNADLAVVHTWADKKTREPYGWCWGNTSGRMAARTVVSKQSRVPGRSNVARKNIQPRWCAMFSDRR
ncbi:hypothetical protein PXNS11_290381 [Stutzerimonas xanthomarina]|nr:hypothetical protein PXNS11_290381 [Stutzerimonas xanthomarina]